MSVTVTVEAIYTDWDSVTDVLFPATVELLVDTDVVHSETRTSVVEDLELAADFFDFPAGAAPVLDQIAADRGARNHQWHRGFASVGLAQDGLQTFVDAVEVQPGVHWLSGGCHHSVVVEQDNGVVVFDAPLYEARCVAMLDWIDASLGAPTTTHVVLSHHHHDHAACARTFVARGATLVVGEDSASHWDGILAAPSTVEPDELAISPVAAPVMLTVPEGGMLLLEDGTRPVRVYDLERHAGDMVMPFVPAAGTIFVVDLFGPGLPSQTVPSGPQEILKLSSGVRTSTSHRYFLSTCDPG